MYHFCLGCKNSGKYPDYVCSDRKHLCLDDEWNEIMTEHCRFTCRLCDSGNINDRE